MPGSSQGRVIHETRCPLKILRAENVLLETSYFVESKPGKVASVLIPPKYSTIREREIRRKFKPIWIYGVQPLRSYPNVVM